MTDAQKTLMELAISECRDDCSYTDDHFPLRLPCPKSGSWINYPPYITHNGCDCIDGYIFNPDPDALWDAVRAKGWDLTMHITVGYPERIYIGNGRGLGKQIAAVKEKDKLRGQAAIQEAVARAVRNEDGH